MAEMTEFLVKMQRTDSDEGWHVQIFYSIETRQPYKLSIEMDVDDFEQAKDLVHDWMVDNIPHKE